jgi:hypothetical protein
LFAAAQKRFRGQPPQQVFRHGKDWVELWDADDFDPWEALRWETVRVIFYRQHTPDYTVIEAYWFTVFPRHRSLAAPSFSWPRAPGKLKTEDSTTPRAATASNISATMGPKACWSDGF